MVIGFLGAGVMARAMARGVTQGGLATAADLMCASKSEQGGLPFLEAFPGARWTADHAGLVRESELIIIAIKPQVAAEVLAPLQSSSAGKLFLSVAAGVTLEKIGSWLDASARIVRGMPNMPMQIGLGASVYAGNANVTAADYELVHRVLASSGQAWQVDETQIDAVTALSGSGPAYVFHFLDALARGGMAAGLSETLARDLARQTLLGSAQLAAQSPFTPLELAAQVKSPGGTTLAGCAVLEQDNALNSLMARCVAAAKHRAEALARGDA